MALEIPREICAQGIGQVVIGPSTTPYALSNSISRRNCRSPVAAQGVAKAVSAARTAIKTKHNTAYDRKERIRLKFNPVDRTP